MLKYGIVIPTLNRPAFLRRTLSYHLDQGMAGEVIVADSSVGEDRKANTRILDEYLGKGLDILHVASDEPTTLLTKILKAVRLSSAEFISLNADDDFVSDTFLRESAEFLTKSPDYSAVSGHTLVLRTDRPGPYGEVVQAAFRPGQVDCVDDRLQDRLLKYETPHWENLWECTRRREHILEILECAIDSMNDGAARNTKHQMPDGQWATFEYDFERAYLFDFIFPHLTLAMGKIKRIPQLMLGNFVHFEGSNAGTITTKERDIVDLVGSPEWIGNLSRYHEIGSEIVARHSRIDRESAAFILKAFTWRHLENELQKRLPHRFLQIVDEEDVYPPTSANRALLRRLISSKLLRSWTRSMLRRSTPAGTHPIPDYLEDDFRRIERVINGAERGRRCTWSPT